eukprot:gene12720-6917_t
MLFVTGNNQFSTLSGDGTGFTGKPQHILTIPGVNTLATGQRHSLVNDAHGNLFGFGHNHPSHNTFGNLTNEVLVSPRKLNTNINVSTLEIGRYSSFLMNAEGSLYVFGDNLSGQLGDGTSLNKEVPTLITAFDNVASVSNYRYHTIVLLKNGSVSTAGGGSGATDGELGDGTTTGRNYFVVLNLNNIIQVAAGQSFSHFLNNAGEIYSCGSNIVGELGDGTTISKSSPQKISLNQFIVQVAAGNAHALFLTKDGLVFATGDNSFGQTGNSTASISVFQYEPGLISGLKNITQISAGERQSLCLNINGSAYAFGGNTAGELGIDLTFYGQTTFYQPTLVELKNIKKIRAGYFHSFFITENDEIFGAGENPGSTKSLGYYGSFVKFSKAPSILQNYSLNAFSAETSFGVDLNSNIYGIGNNFYGQIGDNSTLIKLTPTLGFDKQNIVDVVTTTDSRVTTVLTGTGVLYGLGQNTKYQLAQGTATSRELLPIQILTNVKKLSMGFQNSIAIRNDNTIFGWGPNTYGELCNSTTATAQTTPGKILTIENIAEVSMGYSHTLILHQNGSAYGCGRNNLYQLTNMYSTANQPYPVFILENVQSVSAGLYFSMILHANGSLFSVGQNTKTQLGRSVNADSLSIIPSLSNIVKINAGKYHGTAINQNGKLYRWGSNDNYQSDDSELTTIDTPLLLNKSIYFTHIFRSVSDSSAFYGNPTCNGLNYTDPLVCSGFGNCSTDGTGECFCNNGYLGSNCEISICNGINSNE